MYRLKRGSSVRPENQFNKIKNVNMKSETWKTKASVPKSLFQIKANPEIFALF